MDATERCVAGITIGDPAGIGPEVCLAAVDSIDDPSIIPVLIGRSEVLRRYDPDQLKQYTIFDNHPDSWKSFQPLPGKRYICSIASEMPVPSPGAASAATGAESLQYIDTAIALWRAGVIDCLVTGPVSKAMIEESGTRFTGHTEYIAERINEPHPFMLMFSPDYRVLLITTHCPLAKVAASITPDAIYRTIVVGDTVIRSLDNGPVRIAIAGLDPHCGDQGAIGVFDRDCTAAVVRRCRDQGINVEGPFSADTLFMPERWKRYNLVIAQYHDQGLIPFKMLAFDRGVNVTLGLSMVRTSVDHGTAFDIAGRGLAGHASMVQAILLARRLCRIRG